MDTTRRGWLAMVMGFIGGILSIKKPVVTEVHETETGTWVVYSPGDCTESFESESEALKFANDLIDSYSDCGEWTEGVENILVAKVTHTCQMTNLVTESMLVDGEYNDRYYGEGYDSWCDYEMVPE